MSGIGTSDFAVSGLAVMANSAGVIGPPLGCEIAALRGATSTVVQPVKMYGRKTARSMTASKDKCWKTASSTVATPAGKPGKVCLSGGTGSATTASLAPGAMATAAALNSPNQRPESAQLCDTIHT